MPLKISVIIPTLNEAAGIAQAVARAWQAGADEVIVVDGGSVDGTAAIAVQADCQLVASPRGRALQQNAGARIASGDVLLFLHADTWLPTGGVDQIRQALADASVHGGAFEQRIDAQGILYRALERGNGWRARSRTSPYGDQGLFLRREVFRDLGGFPEVRLMEDLLLMRAFRRRYRLTILLGPLHVSPRRWQRHGIIRQTFRNWSLLVAERCGAHPDRLAKWY